MKTNSLEIINSANGIISYFTARQRIVKEVVDALIDYAEKNQNEVNTSLFGLFFVAHASYGQLKYASENLVFSTNIQNEILDQMEKIKEIDEAPYKLRVKYNAENLPKIEKQIRLLSPFKLLECYDNSDGKEYYLYYSAIKKHLFKANTENKKLLVAQSLKILEKMALNRVKGQHCPLGELKYEFSKKEKSNKEYIPNSPDTEWTKNLIKQTRLFLQNNEKEYCIETKIIYKDFMNICFDNRDKVDVSLVSDFVLETNDPYVSFGFLKHFRDYVDDETFERHEDLTFNIKNGKVHKVLMDISPNSYAQHETYFFNDLPNDPDKRTLELLLWAKEGNKVNFGSIYEELDQMENRCNPKNYETISETKDKVKEIQKTKPDKIFSFN